MKTTMDVLSQIREQTLEYVRAGHEAAVEATRSFYESLGQLVPDLGPLKSAMPTSVPGAGDAREYVEAQFAFARKVLEMEREFSRKLMDVATPKRPARKPAQVTKVAVVAPAATGRSAPRHH